MRLIILTILITLSTSIMAQETIVFKADTTYLYRYVTKDRVEQQKIHWTYKNQQMSYGKDSLLIMYEKGKLDTLFYDDVNRTDTLLFIHNEGNYEFIYNTCCDGFNVVRQHPKRTIPNRFILSATQQDSILIRVGDAWGLVGAGITDTIHDYCQSAMSSNIKQVCFYEIDGESENSPESSLYCFYQKGEERKVYFKPGKRIGEFLFLPLNINGTEIKCFEGGIQF